MFCPSTHEYYNFISYSVYMGTEFACIQHNEIRKKLFYLCLKNIIFFSDHRMQTYYKANKRKISFHGPGAFFIFLFRSFYHLGIKHLKSCRFV